MIDQKIDDRDKTDTTALKEEQPKLPQRKRMVNTENIVQGMMWHEIFSDPLCKRRRDK